MKKIFAVLPIAFIVLILITLLFGCAELNQARVEKKYGSPAKKEIGDDKTIYSYFLSGRRQTCVDFSFDKGGRLIEKRPHYDEGCEQIDPWLNTIAGGEPPRTDVTGRWHDI
jgi:hypothetical protein